MTLSEIRLHIWRALGEDTNLDPDTDVSFGGGPWLTHVANLAQRRVASWKDPQSGRPVRISDLYGSPLFYQSSTIETTIADTSQVSTLNRLGLPLDPFLFLDADRYNGWMFEILDGDAAGQKGYIIDFVNSNIYFAKALTATPTVGDSIALYKNFDMLLPSTHDWVSEHISLPATTDVSRNTGNLLEVLSIVDVDSGKELTPCTRKEKFPGNILQTGDPSQWYRYGNAIYYDVAVDAVKNFRMEYYRAPLDMSDDDDEPDLPPQFHWGIVLWGTWWGFWSKHENPRAYSVKRDLEDFMRRTIEEYDVSKDRLDLGGSVRYE
jgi:hypothetical protein